MHPKLTMAVELARAAAAEAASGRLHPSFERRQSTVVRVVRGLQRNLARQEAAVHRELLAPLEQAVPDGVAEEARVVVGRDTLAWTPEDADLSARILHFHSGGYVLGRPRDGRWFWGTVAREAGVPVISVAYRLAPEHGAEAALEDVLGVARVLMEEGLEPGRLVLAGDSAGGGLAVRALIAARDAGLSLGGAVLGCPWVDLTCPGASMQRNASQDLLVADSLEVWAGLLTDAPADPAVSPTYADLAGLPPLFVALGDLEVLRDDGLAFADRAEAAGVAVERWVAPGSVHCWYLNADGVLPGASGAAERFAAAAAAMLTPG